MKLRSFAGRMRPGYEYLPFHEQLMAAVERAVARPGGRLFIGMPPRHGKSDLVSILLPAWYLGHAPKKLVMHLSYSAELTNSFSLQCRAMMRDDGRFPYRGRVQFGERVRVGDWRTSAGGGFRSVGVGGGVTGHGADLMIIDDPHREDDFESLTKLDRVYTWYTTAARTRLSPGASIIFVMTRWHLLDLAGRLLALGEDGDQWDQFILPAIAGEDDPYGRQPGEALWPSRYPVEELERIKALDERHFQALYQQDPQGDADILFHESFFPRACARESFKTHRDMWSFDLATSESEEADMTVMCGWQRERHSEEMTLVEVIRGRWAFPDVRRRILELARLHPEAQLLFPSDLLEMVMLSELRREDAGLPLVAVKMKGDKRQKAAALASMASRRRVHLWMDGNGVGEWLKEALLFPQGRYDDCVDAAAVAAHHVMSGAEIELA